MCHLNSCLLSDKRYSLGSDVLSRAEGSDWGLHMFFALRSDPSARDRTAGTEATVWEIGKRCEIYQYHQSPRSRNGLSVLIISARSFLLLSSSSMIPPHLVKAQPFDVKSFLDKTHNYGRAYRHRAIQLIKFCR